MPTRFLSNAQRARLSSWPALLSFEELAAHFTLSRRDLKFLEVFRRSNRLGAALQVVAIRTLGFVPKDLKAVPEDAMFWLAD